MLKLKADLDEAGSPPTMAELAAVVMMAPNQLLQYGGVSPSTAVIGVNPRELYDMENSALESRSSPSPDEDYLERSVRNRMLAKPAILRSVAEHRMVEANKSRPQQVDEAKLTTG